MARIDTTTLRYSFVSPPDNDTFIDDESTVRNPVTTAVGALILSLTFLIGVPGNAFIIWSILARARKRSITTLLILNLAFADGFLMALSIFFIVYFAKRNWVFGNTACQLLFYLCNTNMYASIMLIMLMSLHRLMAVVWPHRESAFTSQRIIRRLLLGFWILVLVMAIPGYVFRGEEQAKEPTESPRLECKPKHSNSRHLIFHYLFETVVGFVIPYTIVLASYVCILRSLRQTKFRRRIRSENLILIIVVTFCLFWLPYHVLNVVQVVTEMFWPKSSFKDTIQDCRVITASLAFISSSANPVLYTFAGKSYIHKNGLSFMAKLFEGTALDSESRRNRKISREPRDLALNEREADSSSTSASISTEKNKI
ncbi:leukotriene B4 receptor 2b [Brienomyrus brachyistius]|uniref:leukotriene B4 receptor 2b n=1 Tax=Brienomyrus brachyistius TaxID=42636 RepID=UPI0020B22580|nr:leukotriene B4 receptor 2b [Brienomyrus brachyistius]